MNLERFIIAIALLSVIIATPLAQAKSAQANRTPQSSVKDVVKIVKKIDASLVTKGDPPAPILEPTTQTPLPESSQQVAIAPAVSISCEEAIRQIWPIELQQGAIITARAESSLRTNDIGPMMSDGSIGYNYDGSRDYGCFQINDKAHPDFFANNDWSNPVANAMEGLKIYNDRGNWTAWYAVAGILY